MPLRPIPLGGAPVMVLCFDPTLDGVVSVEDAGTSVLVTDGPCPAIQGLDPALTVRFADLAGLWREPRVAGIAPEHVIVHTFHGARPDGILAAIRHGGRVFHLVDGPGSYFTVNRRGAMALAARRSARRGLARAPGAEAIERKLWVRIDPPFPSLEHSLRAAELAVTRTAARSGSTPAAPLHVLHTIGSLGPGGAERQLTYLAAASRKAGDRVRVLTFYPQTGDEGHYAPVLRHAGIPCPSLPVYPWGQRMPPGISEELARAFEGHMERATLIPLTLDLLRDPPDVLHAWLDTCNAVSGIAGLAAGVPRIVLSTRNVSPRHMPRLDHPYLRETYRLLAGSERVSFLANSHAGAADYADWLGIDVGRFTVVHNGIGGASLAPTTDAQREQVRRSLGVDPQVFLLVGVFRLDPEKAPLEFLEVVAQARARIPGLRAVHLGVGSMSAEVHRRARELGLDGTLSFLGRVEDPERVLGAADVSVLTSRQEGCPNVALESQALAVPVVLTRAGGAPETVEDGETGFVVDVGDVEALVGRLQELAEDRDLRARLGRAGRERVLGSFSLERTVEHTARLYRGD